MNVVDAIANTPVKVSPWSEMSLPIQDILITGIDIEEQ
jgi:hypothetical protein